jgi:hypothetical protein
MIRPDNIHAINSTRDIDDVISSLNLVVKSAALQIKLDFHRSLNLAKMPWWSSSMWALRSNLGESHKLKRESSSQNNIDAYIKQKALYQRALRSSKKESWKSFCNYNLNKDIFGEFKKIVSSSPPNSIPNELIINCVHISNPSEILSAFSYHFFPVSSPDYSSHKIAYDNAKAFSDEPLSSTSTVPFVMMPDLKKAFECLRLTKSPGPHGISSV